MKVIFTQTVKSNLKKLNKKNKSIITDIDKFVEQINQSEQPI